MNRQGTIAMRSRIVRYVIGIIGAFLGVLGALCASSGVFSLYRTNSMLAEREAGGAGEAATIVSGSFDIRFALIGLVCFMLGMGLLNWAVKRKKPRDV